MKRIKCFFGIHDFVYDSMSMEAYAQQFKFCWHCLRMFYAGAKEERYKNSMKEFMGKLK